MVLIVFLSLLNGCGWGLSYSAIRNLMADLICGVITAYDRGEANCLMKDFDLFQCIVCLIVF